MKARQLQDLKRIQTKQLTEDAANKMSGKDLNVEHLNRKKSKNGYGAWTYEYWWSNDNLNKEEARRELQELALWMIRQGEGTGLLGFYWTEKNSVSDIENNLRDKFSADKKPIQRLKEEGSRGPFIDRMYEYLEMMLDESPSYPTGSIEFPDASLKAQKSIKGVPRPMMGLDISPVVNIATLFGVQWQANDTYRYVKNRNQDRSADWICAYCGYRSNDPASVDKHGYEEHENYNHEGDRREFVGRISKLLYKEGDEQ